MIRLENGEHLPSAELRDRLIKATGSEPRSFQSSDDDAEADPAMRESFALFVDLMDRIGAHRRDEVRV